MNLFSRSTLFVGFSAIPFAHGAISFSDSVVSWVDDGSVVAPAVPSPGTFDFNAGAVPIVNDYITGTSGGTLSIGGFSTAAANSPSNRIDPTNSGNATSSLNATVKFTFTGGTGTVRLANSAADDGSSTSTLYNSFSVTNLSGVTGVNIQVTYNEFVAGRSQIVGGNASDTRNFEGLSTLGAIGVTNTGSLAADQISGNVTFGQAFGRNADGSYSPGVPTGSAITASGGGLSGAPTVAGSDVTFASSGLSGTVGLGGLSPNFLFLRAFDTNENGLDASDGENFYAKSITFDLVPEVGTFDNDTAFTVSLDGEQYLGSFQNVPEPSSLFVLSLAAVGGLVRRRRVG